MPQIPTLDEQGIKNAEAIVWFGMSAPAKTPRPILEKLNREVNKTLQLADVKQRLDQLGLEVEGGTSEKFDAFIKSQAARLNDLIKAGGVELELKVGAGFAAHCDGAASPAKCRTRCSFATAAPDEAGTAIA